MRPAALCWPTLSEVPDLAPADMKALAMEHMGNGGAKNLSWVPDYSEESPVPELERRRYVHSGVEKEVASENKTSELRPRCRAARCRPRECYESRSASQIENHEIMDLKTQIKSAQQNKKALEKKHVIVADLIAALKAKKTCKDLVSG